MEEIWKDVLGYENLYLVSNFGRIKSLYHKNKIMQVYTNQQGYSIVRLHKNKKRTGLLLHRIVAKAFIPNPNNKPEVNHIDGNKLNNCVNNLEWVTSSENTIHAYNNKLLSRDFFGSLNIPRRKKVIQLDTNYNIINIYASLTEAGKCTGIKTSNISSCCLHKYRYKTAGGFIWIFEK